LKLIKVKINKSYMLWNMLGIGYRSTHGEVTTGHYVNRVPFLATTAIYCIFHAVAAAPFILLMLLFLIGIEVFFAWFVEIATQGHLVAKNGEPRLFHDLAAAVGWG
jgi:hypothetical protein